MDVVMKRIPDAISVPAKAIFTHEGKPIVYLSEKNRYRPVEIQVTIGVNNGAEVFVRVDDDGPGVPPEDRDRVFQAGFSRQAGGSGQGLAFVREVVEIAEGAHDVRRVLGPERADGLLERPQVARLVGLAAARAALT